MVPLRSRRLFVPGRRFFFLTPVLIIGVTGDRGLLVVISFSFSSLISIEFTADESYSVIGMAAWPIFSIGGT